jgi:hypothetical protein
MGYSGNGLVFLCLIKNQTKIKTRKISQKCPVLEEINQRSGKDDEKQW